MIRKKYRILLTKKQMFCIMKQIKPMEAIICESRK